MLTSIFDPIHAELKKHSVQDFDIYHEKTHELQLSVKDAQAETHEAKVSAGVGLRIFHEGRQAFSYTSDLSAEALAKLAAQVAQLLSLSEADPDLRLPDFAPLPKLLELGNDDPDFSRISMAQKTELALEMEAAARAQPRIQHVRGASYQESRQEIALMNSQGFAHQYAKTHYHLSIMAVAEDGDAESAYEFESACFFGELKPRELGDKVARRALAYLGGTTPETGLKPIVLENLVVAEFLAALLPSFQGDQVYQGRSSLAGKLGERLYDPRLELVDDSSLKSALASAPFDAEGEPARRLELVSQGQLRNYLLDSYYGRKLKLPGNASSVRESFRRAPAISHSNVQLKAGSAADAELCALALGGIWISDVIGMHAIDLITGDFSVGAMGFAIEPQGLGRPLKKFAIAGNVHKLFGNILGLGRDLRYYEAIAAPSLAVGNLSVSGA